MPVLAVFRTDEAMSNEFLAFHSGWSQRLPEHGTCNRNLASPVHHVSGQGAGLAEQMLGDCRFPHFDNARLCR